MECSRVVLTATITVFALPSPESRLGFALRLGSDGRVITCAGVNIKLGIPTTLLTLCLGANFLPCCRRVASALPVASSAHFDRACIYRVMATVRSLDLSSLLL
jgi:hypothetical protein